MAGNLEMAQVNNAFLGSLYPGTMIFDLPFIFRDNDHMRKVVRGPIGGQIYGEFEKRTGIKLVLAGLADGPRSVFNRTRPVTTPGDLKGMKLRVMENPIMVDTFKALGAIPTPMAFPEIYMAAKQGVIDGAETPPTGLIDMKAPEIAKYYSLTRHFAMPSAVAVNAKWLAGLPAEYRKAFHEAEAEAAAWYDKVYEDEGEKALAIVKKAGMEINSVKDINEFRTAVMPVYEKYGERAGGKKLIDEVIATK
jgi:TRAP-type transport system periplasmic protein